MGGDPPPPGPPVPQDCDCQPVMLPSLLAATFTRAYADGRAPATFSSASRSSMIRTGRPPAFLESLAAVLSHLSAENLLPKPPPMWSWWTRMLAAGTPSGSAIWDGTPETFCVEM